jgi:hypothetical protein
VSSPSLEANTATTEISGKAFSSDDKQNQSVLTQDEKQEIKETEEIKEDTEIKETKEEAAMQIDPESRANSGLFPDDLLFRLTPNTSDVSVVAELLETQIKDKGLNSYMYLLFLVKEFLDFMRPGHGLLSAFGLGSSQTRLLDHPTRKEILQLGYVLLRVLGSIQVVNSFFHQLIMIHKEFRDYLKPLNVPNIEPSLIATLLSLYPLFGYFQINPITKKVEYHEEYVLAESVTQKFNDENLIHYQNANRIPDLNPSESYFQVKGKIVPEDHPLHNGMISPRYFRTYLALCLAKYNNLRKRTVYIEILQEF